MKAVPGWKIREIGTLNSFHGPLDMDEAETRLRRAGKDRCYLTRYSESIEEHILSVLRRKNDDDLVLQHFCIAIQLEGQLAVSYEILGSTKKFKSITGLLEFYKKNPLNHKIDSTGDKIERGIILSACTIKKKIGIVMIVCASVNAVEPLQSGPP